MATTTTTTPQQIAVARTKQIAELEKSIDGLESLRELAPDTDSLEATLDRLYAWRDALLVDDLLYRLGLTN